MAGLKDKRGFIDKDRLDLSERQAVEYWMKRWGVTRDQLTAAHRKAGRMVKDIAAELGKKRRWPACSVITNSRKTRLARLAIAIPRR